MQLKASSKTVVLVHYFYRIIYAAAESKSVESGDKHVFISYQWNDKPTVLKLSDRLKAAGFRLWIDEDNMCKIVFLKAFRFQRRLKTRCRCDGMVRGQLILRQLIPRHLFPDC
jgi:TIR domain